MLLNLGFSLTLAANMPDFAQVLSRSQTLRENELQ
jgi:hypothetical protein